MEHTAPRAQPRLHPAVGPLASSRQRDTVERMVVQGVAEGATLAVGGGRPQHLERGFFFEPTVFANVDNHSFIAQRVLRPGALDDRRRQRSARHRHDQ